LKSARRHRAGPLIWVAIALIVIGLVLTIAAVALVVLISRRAERAAEGA